MSISPMNLALARENASDAYLLRGRSFVDRDRDVFVDVPDGEWSIGYWTSLHAKLLWYSYHDVVTDVVNCEMRLSFSRSLSAIIASNRRLDM